MKGYQDRRGYVDISHAERQETGIGFEEMGPDGGMSIKIRTTCVRAPEWVWSNRLMAEAIVCYLERRYSVRDTTGSLIERRNRAVRKAEAKIPVLQKTLNRKKAEYLKLKDEGKDLRNVNHALHVADEQIFFARNCAALAAVICWFRYRLSFQVPEIAEWTSLNVPTVDTILDRIDEARIPKQRLPGGIRNNNAPRSLFSRLSIQLANARKTLAATEKNPWHESPRVIEPRIAKYKLRIAELESRMTALTQAVTEVNTSAA